MWLPDGRRKVWRTGESERGAAERAARTRLDGLLRSPVEPTTAPSSGAPRSPIAPQPPHSAFVLPDEASEPPASTVVAPGHWLSRFEAWFFADLRRLVRGS